jgi:secondary thiamine-phosphate synthase enzyme
MKPTDGTDREGFGESKRVGFSETERDAFSRTAGVLEMLTPTPICHHAAIRVETEGPTEFIDLTDRLRRLIAQSRVHCGIVNIQALHTTLGIIVNELEPLLLDDFSALLERAAPGSRGYRHDDIRLRTVNLTPHERVNGHAHCRALLLGSAVSLNVADGKLRLGRWQRVLMVELDGPQLRELSVVVIGERRQ